MFKSRRRTLSEDATPELILNSDDEVYIRRTVRNFRVLLLSSIDDKIGYTNKYSFLATRYSKMTIHNSTNNNTVFTGELRRTAVDYICEKDEDIASMNFFCWSERESKTDGDSSKVIFCDDYHKPRYLLDIRTSQKAKEFVVSINGFDYEAFEVIKLDDTFYIFYNNDCFSFYTKISDVKPILLKYVLQH